MAGRNLGGLIRSRRQQTLNQRTGRAFTQAALAETVGVSRETISAIENGEIQTASPELAEGLERVLGISALEVVRAMGYQIAFEGIEDEEDVALLQAYRSASDERRDIARAALQLGPVPPSDGRLDGLRRLVATGRQGRRETQE